MCFFSERSRNYTDSTASIHSVFFPCSFQYNSGSSEDERKKSLNYKESLEQTHPLQHRQVGMSFCWKITFPQTLFVWQSWVTNSLLRMTSKHLCQHNKLSPGDIKSPSIRFVFFFRVFFGWRWWECTKKWKWKGQKRQTEICKRLLSTKTCRYIY